MATEDAKPTNIDDIEGLDNPKNADLFVNVDTLMIRTESRTVHEV